MTEVVAAIDCGSNSTRLLIADARGVTLARDMKITRLSEGVDASGRLREEAMARTFSVLGEYRAQCDRYGVARGRLVATSAVRDAANGDVFLAGAREITGLEANLLAGSEEAALSYRGATADLAPSTMTTVIVDVGGGSTELASEIDGHLVSYSMQLGCVRIAERALGRDVVTPARDDAARAMIDAEIARAFLERPEFETLVGSARLIGLAGTVATLAQLDARLDHYDRDVVHHRVVSLETVEWWQDRLASETPAHRLRHPGMVRGREDVLVAGLYVLDAVMRRLGVSELMSSENDILDGIVGSLLEG